MSTDPFNTADTRFDEMSHPLADYCDHAGVGKACRECRRRFDVSAQWAIDYLTKQEPTDAESIARKNLGDDAVDRLAAHFGVTQKPTDYQIDVAMDAYAEASGQSVSRPWMEAAIHAYESAARRNEEKRDG